MTANSKYVRKDLCEERSSNIQAQVEALHTDVKEIKNNHMPHILNEINKNKTWLITITVILSVLILGKEAISGMLISLV